MCPHFCTYSYMYAHTCIYLFIYCLAFPLECKLCRYSSLTLLPSVLPAPGVVLGTLQAPNIFSLNEWMNCLNLSSLETSGKSRNFKALFWLLSAWCELVGAFCFLSNTWAGQGWHGPFQLWAHSDSCWMFGPHIFLFDLCSILGDTKYMSICAPGSEPSSPPGVWVLGCWVKIPNKERKIVFGAKDYFQKPNVKEVLSQRLVYTNSLKTGLNDSSCYK